MKLLIKLNQNFTQIIKLCPDRLFRMRNVYRLLFCPPEDIKDFSKKSRAEILSVLLFGRAVAIIVFIGSLYYIENYDPIIYLVGALFVNFWLIS